MSEVLDERVADLARASALEVQELAARNRLTRINERDHLQRACASAARRVAPKWTPPAEVSTRFRFSSDRWPRLGGVDLTLLFVGIKPVALELKCGSGRDALGPCAWDVLKLALALDVGVISAGYLLAAAPVREWSQRFRGAEFFETAQVSTGDLREHYLDWWRRWERLGDPAPNEVPARFETRAISRASAVLAGEAWELRLAAVLLSTRDRVRWQPTVAAASP